MRVVTPLLGPILLLLLTLSLTACDTAEERAETHYQRGMALLAEGDADRAMVEFRNVFRLNGDHIPARLEYARILRERGDVEGAAGQYLRLVEQDPKNVDGHKALTELALAAGDFASARTHADQAFALAPQDPEIRAFKATLDYRDGEREAALATAEGVLAEAPGTVAAHMVLIADRLQAEAPQEALGLAEAALVALPAEEELHLARLAALEAIGDQAAIGAALETMTERFLENEGMRAALVQWHIRQGDLDAAEAALRESAERHSADPERQLELVQFLLELRGGEAARTELDRLIAGAADPRPFQRARAALDFAQGRRDEAIAALRALTEGAEPSDEVRDMEVALAVMLDATGDEAGRDALLARVLEGDRTHIPALKLRARAAIEADKPELAIQDMRTALGEAPRDPEIMTIMAMAHAREGSRELAGERLALALEASDRGAAESLRYAQFLMEDGRIGPAEAVLADALRRTPENPDLLVALGEIHLARRDWSRARQVVERLRAAGASRAAAGLQMAVLAGEGRHEETRAILTELAATGENAAAMAQLVGSYLETGDLEAAQGYLDGVLAKDPASLPGRLLQAELHALRGEARAAEELYRALVAEAPARPEPHRALAAFLNGQGRADAALAVLEAGIAATGGDADLMAAKAGLLEAGGDFEGAIALYEALYARDSANPVIANNLASLISSRRSDPESLERAFAIARRLRSASIPQFQDTYGWILHLRGASEQALAYLEPAAQALPGDALVQFHLGEARFALGQWAPARESFARALEIAEAAGNGAALPQLEAARARIAEIDAAPAPADSEG